MFLASLELPMYILGCPQIQQTSTCLSLSLHVVLAGLELKIYLLLPPKEWD